MKDTDSQDGRHRHTHRQSGWKTQTQDRKHIQSGWQTQTVGMEDTVSQDGRHRQSEWKTQIDRMEDTDRQSGWKTQKQTYSRNGRHTHSQDGKHKHRHSGLKTRAQTDSQDRRRTQNVRIEDTDKKLGWKTQSWDWRHRLRQTVRKTDTDTQEGTQTEIHTGTETVSHSYQLTFTEVRFIRHFWHVTAAVTLMAAATTAQVTQFEWTIPLKSQHSDEDRGGKLAVYITTKRTTVNQLKSATHMDLVQTKLRGDWKATGAEPALSLCLQYFCFFFVLL